MSYNQLTENERYQIYSLKKAGHSQAECTVATAAFINDQLRAEAQRWHKRISAWAGQTLSDVRLQEAAKARKITGGMSAQIEKLIRQELSPQQVVDYLERPTWISLYHETISQLICEDNAGGGDLYCYLRIVSKPYRKRYGKHDRRAKIKDRVGVDQRL